MSMAMSGGGVYSEWWEFCGQAFLPSREIRIKDAHPPLAKILLPLHLTFGISEAWYFSLCCAGV